MKILAILILAVLPGLASASTNPKFSSVEMAARIAGVDWVVIHALMLRESQKMLADKTVQPWAYVVDSKYYDGFAKACEVLGEKITDDNSSVDIGVAGINWRYNGHKYVDDPCMLLNPDLNVVVGGMVLQEAVRLGRGDLRKALSIYNSGKALGNLAYADYILVVSKRLRQQQ